MRNILLSLALLCGVLSGCTSHVVTVIIDNKSAAPIRNLEVTFAGGSYGLSSIPAGQSRQNRIKPFGPSTLEIQYVDASGTKKTQTGPRVTKNDRGTIQITIDNNGFKWTGTVTNK